MLPNQWARISFQTRAPSTPGAYREDFGMVAEGIAWQGGFVPFDITVL